MKIDSSRDVIRALKRLLATFSSIWDVRYWPKRTSRWHRGMSAFGAEADVTYAGKLTMILRKRADTVAATRDEAALRELAAASHQVPACAAL
jgi:hypothetical protein